MIISIALVLTMSLYKQFSAVVRQNQKTNTYFLLALYEFMISVTRSLLETN